MINLLTLNRGVGILYKLPVILKPNVLFPAMDGDDESHILPAFQKLVDLFWTFDQSRAFEIIEGSSADLFDTGDMESARRNSLYTLHTKLQEVSLDWDTSNEVQRADICVTRQWMRAVLWKASNNYERLNSGSQITSLDHPIQIAREFLGFISQLPSTALEAHGPTMVCNQVYCVFIFANIENRKRRSTRSQAQWRTQLPTMIQSHGSHLIGQ